MWLVQHDEIEEAVGVLSRLEGSEVGTGNPNVLRQREDIFHPCSRRQHWVKRHGERVSAREGTGTSAGSSKVQDPTCKCRFPSFAE